MLMRSLAELRTDVRTATDSAGESARKRHSDEELTRAINRGRYAFFKIVSECNGGDRTITSTTINTVDGTSTYVLPTNFERLVSVDASQNGTTYWMQPFQHEERSSYGADSCGVDMSYRLVGSSLEILPVPSGAYELTVRYVPHPTDFAVASDNYDSIARAGDEYVIYWAARIICEKDAAWDKVDRYSARLVELEDDARTYVRMRDQSAPPRIVDVYGARWKRAYQ